MTIPFPIVLLVDDHPLFRQGLRMLLSSSDVIQADFLEAGSVAEAAGLAARVNLILLDISMPGCDGLSGLAQLRQRWPGAFIVMVSGHDHPELMRDAVRQGASGFMSKALSPQAICEQVQYWLRCSQSGEQGERVAWGQAASSHFIGNPVTPPDEKMPVKQYEVLKLLAQGYSNKAIAKQFEVSEHTIRNQVVAILRYFNAETRTQAVASAQRQGMLPAVVVK